MKKCKNCINWLGDSADSAGFCTHFDSIRKKDTYIAMERPVSAYLMTKHDFYCKYFEKGENTNKYLAVWQIGLRPKSRTEKRIDKYAKCITSLKKAEAEETLGVSDWVRKEIDAAANRLIKNVRKWED